MACFISLSLLHFPDLLHFHDLLINKEHLYFTCTLLFIEFKEAPGYRLRHAEPPVDGFMVAPPNPTPSFEHAKPFTSGARTVYSVLPRSLTWPPPLHRLRVDFVAKSTNPTCKLRSLAATLHWLLVGFVAKPTNRFLTEGGVAVCPP